MGVWRTALPERVKGKGKGKGKNGLRQVMAVRHGETWVDEDWGTEVRPLSYIQTVTDNLQANATDRQRFEDQNKNPDPSPDVKQSFPTNLGGIRK